MIPGSRHYLAYNAYRFGHMVLALLFGWLLPVLGQPSQGVTFWNYLDNAWTNITQGHISPQNLGSLLQPYQAPTNFFGD